MKKEKNESLFTNLEVFFLLIGIGCATLGIGFNNIILTGVAIFSGFMTFGSMIKRNYKKKNE